MTAIANTRPILTSAAVRQAYTADYYLNDCGGYETYRATAGKALDQRLTVMAQLLRYHPRSAPLRLLDLGCGRGELSRHAASLGHWVEAIDYSPEALALAEGCFAGEPELRARVTFIHGSVTDSQHWHGHYDLIVAADLIEHLAPSELEVLYALARAHLAPDGVLVVHTFPNLWHYRYGYACRRRQDPSLAIDPRSEYERAMHINEQSPRVLRHQLNAAFPEVCLWAGDLTAALGTLGQPVRLSAWRDAPSLFALAARQPIVIERLRSVLTTPLATAAPAAYVIANQPEIDWATLNERVGARLEQTASIPQPPPFVFTPTPAASQELTLAQITARHDEDFVRQALWSLLGSQDALLFDHSLRRLRDGEDKGQILAWLSRFPEAQTHCPALYRQLRLHRLKHWLVRKPGLIGKLFKNLFALAQLGSQRAQLNAMLNELYRFDTEHRQQLEVLEKTNAQRAKQSEQHYQTTIGKQQQTIQDHEDRIQRQAEQISALKHRLAQMQPPAVTASPLLAEDMPALDPAFEVALADRLRGDCAEIVQRLRYYVPMIKENAVLRSGQWPAVDLGCGRGEWLTLLAAEGIAALGLELNPHHIAQCQQDGHQVIHAEALAWLNQRPAASVALISAFQLIEHLPFAALAQLVTQAARVLVPGGLLLLETPNPENLITAAHSFYLDPTHHQPLPPQLLELMLDYYGFTAIEIHRINPIPQGLQIPDASATAARCNQLFYGAQDYAISAQVPALDSIA